MAKLIVLISLLLLGYFINQKFALKKEKEAIKYFIIFIGLPILILHSILSQHKIEFGLIALVITLSLILNIFLSRTFNKLLNFKHGGALLLLNSFSNAGFLGLPLCWILFQNQGLYYGSLYVLGQFLVHYTAGLIGALESKRKHLPFYKRWRLSVKDAFQFPVIWVFILILILTVLEVKFPPGLMNGFGYIGKITLFLSLFYLGLNFERPTQFKKFYFETLYVGTFRFLISPLIVVVLSLVLKIAQFHILAFQAMMPPAIANTILAGYFGLNEKLAATVTTILTLLFLFIFVLIKLFLKY